MNVNAMQRTLATYQAARAEDREPQAQTLDLSTLYGQDQVTINGVTRAHPTTDICGDIEANCVDGTYCM